MDGRSIHEGVCDMVWYNNLKLLGFPDAKPTMFDYSNATGFQQVFHFLFGKILTKEKSHQEFRDCWPILDKKQEADFRRRIVQMLKDYHKEDPEEMPFVNPSLFQSPGGRKFLGFLSVFTTFTMKQLTRSGGNDLFFKPNHNKLSKKLRLVALKHLVDRTNGKITEGVNYQVQIEENEQNAVETAGYIMDKFMEHKNTLKEMEEGIEADETENCVEPFNFTDKEEVVKEVHDKSKQVFEMMSNCFDAINFVLEGGAEKIQLNLGVATGSTADSSLITTYQSLLTSLLASAEVTARTPAQQILLPGDWDVEAELTNLAQLSSGLEQSHVDARAATNDMLTKSKAIDWATCPLSLSMKDKVEGVKVLPPTPSIVTRIRNPETETETWRQLTLASPDPRLLTPRHGTAAALRGTPARSSAPSGVLTRRFLAPKLDPEACNSPSLKQKAEAAEVEEPLPLNSPVVDPTPAPPLATSTEHNLTTQSVDLTNTSVRTTKSSIGAPFSPLLSSTATTFGPEQEERTFSELAETSRGGGAGPQLDITASKIEIYRRVLEGLKSQSGVEDKSMLMSAWTAHRESLSPRVTRPPRSQSPAPINFQSPVAVKVSQVASPLVAAATPPPAVKSPQLDELVISRLDQLMTSLTLNENPSGLNISLDAEMDLLSPHL